MEHAIRATFDTTRRGYVHPATHYASDACGRSLPPMGLRLRTKRSYYEEHLADFELGSQARPIFEALRRYGMIVADNGSNFFSPGPPTRGGMTKTSANSRTYRAGPSSWSTRRPR